ncbi:MAG: hypothetical protein RL235_236 [Chlamydiota bacterium]|jgi:arsenate reductase-like glutaredoxin family protein
MRRTAEKKTVSETEHELVLGIPLVVRFRPVVVQPRTILIAFNVEDVRVPVGVGFAWYATRITALVK